MLSKRTFATVIAIFSLLTTLPAQAQVAFDPQFIISDPELEDTTSWSRSDVQRFLIERGSYLSNYTCTDVSGTVKLATDIIYDAAQKYRINPKFLLVTLQKEQSLVTDDTPSSKQLDWATGYAVCDSCDRADPRVQKFKGFGAQVDNAAGIMRWYYDNQSNPIVKKKDTPLIIDNTSVTPGSWATAFLYTYTPHLHGNANFWRIWNTWFQQVYPNGTLLVSASTSGDNYWLIENGEKRHFKNKTALITRTDPRNALRADPIDLTNYKDGVEIAFPNYSILHSPNATYLLDYDTLRPFASDEVVAKLGFNPDEVIDVAAADLTGYTTGLTITASSSAPQGVVYQITDLKNAYYLLKDETLFPITDKALLAINYKNLPIEKHRAKDLRDFPMADLPVVFKDGTLLKEKDSSQIYVIDHGKKRPLADDDTFIALGYQRGNIATAERLTLLNIPSGEPLFMNAGLLSSKNKFLGDNGGTIPDLYAKNNLAAYLVAEYPSGRVISGKNIDTRRTIASLTKLLTGYEALHQGFNLTKSTVYKQALYDTGSNPIGFKNGDIITNKVLLNTMLVASNNSAARMIAQATKLDENSFINSINTRLGQWGADSTVLHDVTGLDAENKSTARDLLKIFTTILDDKTMRAALGQATYTFIKTDAKRHVSTRLLHNTNQIIKNIPTDKRDYKVLATKTGYTEEADATLMMLIESKKNKKQYIVITLGNPDYAKRFEQPHKLAEWLVTTPPSQLATAN